MIFKWSAAFEVSHCLGQSAFTSIKAIAGSSTSRDSDGEGQ